MYVDWFGFGFTGEKDELFGLGFTGGGAMYPELLSIGT